jgi:hypothetical protein
MNAGVAFFARNHYVVAYIGAAVFNFNDVMSLKRLHWSK